MRKGWTCFLQSVLCLKSYISCFLGVFAKRVRNLPLLIEKGFGDEFWESIEVCWSSRNQGKQSWKKQHSARSCCNEAQPCYMTRELAQGACARRHDLTACFWDARSVLVLRHDSVPPLAYALLRQFSVVSWTAKSISFFIFESTFLELFLGFC